jgi:hypothetical protein
MKIVRKTMAAVVIIIAAAAPVYMTGRTKASIIFQRRRGNERSKGEGEGLTEALP